MTQRPELDPGKYARAIAASEAYATERTRFAQQVTEGYVNPRNEAETLQARRSAISMGAASLTHNEKAGFDGFDRAVFDVISQIGTVVETVKELSELRDRRARGFEKDPYKMKLIAFNHALRNMIDQRPSVSYHQVIALLENAYKPMADPNSNDRQIFSSELHTSLTGVRHEIGFEQIVGFYHEIKDETSLLDDAHGDDIEVLVDDVWVPFDVKSSLEKTEKTQEYMRKAREKGYHDNPNLVIWSHLTVSDFGDGFMISPQLAEAKYAEIAPLLYQAADSVKIAA